MTTTDEALRVAREALAEIEWSNDSKWQSDRARSALRTIALAVEAPSDGVEVDRDSDGELLIDWFPSPGRMLTMSLRHDGRLSYAFRWDGEQAHGTAQMPPAVQSVALAGGWGELRKDFDFDLASASGAVGETAEFQVWMEDDVFCADAMGPREQALAEARHYAAQYAQDGPVRIEKITRTVVERIPAGLPCLRKAVRLATTKQEDGGAGDPSGDGSQR